MKNNNLFQIKFEENWFKKKDIIIGPNNTKLEILDTPKPHYNKWYWKILNQLTFKLFFNASYAYTVKILKSRK